MKRALATAVQAAISIGLIWWIFRDPDKRALMAGALGKADLAWFVPGIAAIGAAIALQTVRWRILLRAIGIDLGWLRCAQLLMIGMFFNLFLLGATGGDVVKIYYTMREAGGARAAAFLSIVVDRVVGVVALAAVSIGVVIARWDALVSTSIAQAFLGTLAIIMGGFIAIIAAGAAIAIFRLQDRLPARMPLRQTLVDLAVATDRYARSPRALLSAFLLSIPSHLLLFTPFYFAARALGSKAGLMDVASVMPIVNTITSLPISLSGIGIREQLFESLMASMYQIPKAESVLISLGGYLMMAAWCLVGGIVYLAYRPSEGRAATLHEIEEAAEHPEAQP